jgi:glutamate dehydrogenase (NAD(P)+)
MTTQADSASPYLSLRCAGNGWEGFLVIDTMTPFKCLGGVRLGDTVTEAEVARLARAMTLKTRALGLRFGGAKAGIRYSPAGPHRRTVLLEFFKRIQALCESVYSFGPDMNTSEDELDAVAAALGMSSRIAAIAGATSDPVAALSRYHGALKLRVGPMSMGEARTGAGAVGAVLAIADSIGLRGGLRVGIQGFGAVGAGVAWLLHRDEHKVTGVADVSGFYRDPDGLDIDELLRLRGSERQLDPSRVPARWHAGPPDGILRHPVDVLVLAATPDSVNAANAAALQAKSVVEAGNIAVTAEANELLRGRGIPVVPDFIASGGAIALADGVLHGNMPHADAGALAEVLRRRVGGATAAAAVAARQANVSMRDAALRRLTYWNGGNEDHDC